MAEHKLVREPVAALGKALGRMHANMEADVPQDQDISAYVLGALDKNELKQLRDYLDKLLKERAVTDADLKTLFENHAKAWTLSSAEDARAFFEGLNDSVREKTKGGWF